MEGGDGLPEQEADSQSGLPFSLCIKIGIVTALLALVGGILQISFGVAGLIVGSVIIGVLGFMLTISV